jgi:hypothetical protein
MFNLLLLIIAIAAAIIDIRADNKVQYKRGKK